MSETDAEFVENLVQIAVCDWDQEQFDRFFDIARRGAAAIADDQCKKEPELPHQDRRYNNAERLFGDD